MLRGSKHKRVTDNCHLSKWSVFVSIHGMFRIQMKLTENTTNLFSIEKDFISSSIPHWLMAAKPSFSTVLLSYLFCSSWSLFKHWYVSFHFHRSDLNIEKMLVDICLNQIIVLLEFLIWTIEKSRVSVHLLWSIFLIFFSYIMEFLISELLWTILLYILLYEYFFIWIWIFFIIWIIYFL